MPSVGTVTSNLTATAQSGAYTAKASDLVLANAAAGAFAVTLPTAPATNTMIAVKKTDATTSAVTVVPPAGVSIDADTTGITLVSAGSSVTVQWDGTVWRIVSTATVNVANSIAGIPVGGTIGQALVKNTTTNYDAGWASIGTGGMFQPWTVPARYYLPWPMNNLAQVTQGGGGNFTCYPLRIPNDCTIASIGLYVYTSSGNIGIGLHADAPTATSIGPGARQGTSTAKAATASAYNSWAIGASVKAGNYWIVYGADSTTNSVYGCSFANWINNWTNVPGPTTTQGMRYLTTQGGGFGTAADYSTYASATISLPVPAFYITVS